MPVPVLFVSDSPDLSSGLARIGRDLATRLHESGLCRVGYLGKGGTGSRHFSFPTYFMSDFTLHSMGVTLPRVWADFAGGEKGVVFTIADPSWLLWFTDLFMCQRLGAIKLANWLATEPFQRWGYFPIDSHGPNGILSRVQRDVIHSYDRVLCYTKWAEEVVRKGMLWDSRLPGAYDLQSLPHGIDTSVFKPCDPMIARKELSIPKDAFLVGCVMTNQSRKDWGLAAAICSLLKKREPKFRAWWHVDALERYWSIPALLVDFGINDVVHVTLGGSDQDMAERYSACDVTMLPSLGEGFGYPLRESESCGTVAVHVDYAGGVESCIHVVSPTAYRYDGLFNSVRPVTEAHAWVDAITGIVLGEKEIRCIPSKYDWHHLWPKWEKWWAEGLVRLKT